MCDHRRAFWGSLLLSFPVFCPSVPFSASLHIRPTLPFCLSLPIFLLSRLPHCPHPAAFLYPYLFHLCLSFCFIFHPSFTPYIGFPSFLSVPFHRTIFQFPVLDIPVLFLFFYSFVCLNVFLFLLPLLLLLLFILLHFWFSPLVSSASTPLHPPMCAASCRASDGGSVGCRPIIVHGRVTPSSAARRTSTSFRIRFSTERRLKV